MENTSKLSFKPGVKIAGVRSEIAIAINVAASVYFAYGYDCIVTSVVDGKHSRGSLHYSGGAMDLRTRHLPNLATVKSISHDIREGLTDEFDIILEKDHIHIEFQPKGPTS